MAQRTDAGIPSFVQAQQGQQTAPLDLQTPLANFVAARKQAVEQQQADLANKLKEAQLRMNQLKLDPEIAQLRAQTGLVQAQTDLAQRKEPSLPSSALTGFLTPEQIGNLPPELPRESFDTLVKAAEARQRAQDAKEAKRQAKAVPVAEVSNIGKIRSLLNQMKPVEDLYKQSLVNGDSPFVGPKDARVQSVKQLTGSANPAFATFKSNLYGIRNQILNMLSGAAISPAEYKRLITALPDENTNEKDFEAKLENFKAVQNDIVNEKLTAFKQAGYDTSNLEVGQVSRTGGSTTPKQGAEARYNELIASGMSEDQVYQQLAQEGF